QPRLQLTQSRFCFFSCSSPQDGARQSVPALQVSLLFVPVAQQRKLPLHQRRRIANSGALIRNQAEGGGRNRKLEDHRSRGARIWRSGVGRHSRTELSAGNSFWVNASAGVSETRFSFAVKCCSSDAPTVARLLLARCTWSPRPAEGAARNGL